MSEIADSEFPALFAHGTRKDWGLGVLTGERDGKRSYLFESGEERIIASAAWDMMRKVSPLDSEQEATLARLTALVARRQGRPDPSKPAGFSLVEQLDTLRLSFPRGLRDAEWKTEGRAGRLRGQRLSDAQNALSMASLDALLKAQQFEAVWTLVAKTLRSSELVPNEQLKVVAASGTPPQIAGAVRELLYGSATLEQRIDRFVVAYETAFKKQPRWETVTALLALSFPSEYVLVDLASFRKQLKALGAKGTLPPRPTGAAYARCANAARVVSGKLAEGGELPQDLLDVHDFIRFTLKTKPPARPGKAATKAGDRAAADDSADDSEESSDDSE